MAPLPLGEGQVYLHCLAKVRPAWVPEHLEAFPLPHPVEADLAAGRHLAQWAAEAASANPGLRAETMDALVAPLRVQGRFARALAIAGAWSRQGLARNPALPADVAAGLAEDAAVASVGAAVLPRWAGSALSNPAVPDGVLAGLFALWPKAGSSGPRVEGLRALLSNPSLPASIRRDAMADRWPSVWEDCSRAIVSGIPAGEVGAHLEDFAGHLPVVRAILDDAPLPADARLDIADPDVALRVVRNPRAHPSLRAEAARRDMGRALASVSADDLLAVLAPRGHLARLTGEEMRLVRERCTAMTLYPCWIPELADAPGWAANPHAPPEVLRRLLRRGEDLSHNPALCDPGIMAALAKDRSPHVRAAIAAHPLLVFPSVQDKLARSAHGAVTEALANNPAAVRFGVLAGARIEPLPQPFFAPRAPAPGGEEEEPEMPAERAAPAAPVGAVGARAR